jgi:mRNA interferase HicA
LCDIIRVTTREFIKLVRQCGKADGIDVVYESGRGRGSHGRLFYGTRRTIVAEHGGDIPVGTLRAMQKQLGLEGRF